MEFEQRLAALADSNYKIFNDKLICTGYPSYGVRMPDIRKLAKQLLGTISWEEICAYLPQSFEGVVLKGLMIANETQPERFFAAWDDYYPLFDSWAQTDTVVPSLKIMKRNKQIVLERYARLKTSTNPFDRRFLVILLMDYFISDDTVDYALSIVKQVTPGDYYVDMAVAWMLSVVGVSYYQKLLDLLKSGVFSKFTHNKAIQKCRESFRITEAQKAELKTLRRTT